MIKRTILSTMLLLGLATLVFAQQVDFNGTWRLDERASQITTGDGLEGLGDHAPANLYITQRRNRSLIISSRLPGSQPRAYQMGGSTWVPAPRPSTGKFLMSSRVRGLQMVSEASGEVEGEIVTVREVLTMDRSGGKITLEVTTNRPWGPETNKLVYIRAGGGGSR
jgi:hypothetical protein